MSEGWAYVEMNGATVGDHRSRQALGRICQRLAEQPEASFSSACGSAVRQAARRVFRRPDSKVEALLAGHYRQTAARCAAHPCVLVAQDTTEFNYTHHPATTGLGPTSHSARRGLLGHAALALTPEGEPLGLLHLDLWARDPETVGQAATRRQRETAEKESRKWGDGLAAVAQHLPTGPEVLVIQDREGDVFAFLATPRRPGLHLLVRAAQARKVALPTGSGTSAEAIEAAAAAEPAEPAEAPTTLFAVAAAAPQLGEVTVALPARAATKGRSPQAAREERDARLTVRATPLLVQPPRHRKARDPDTPQLLWVIHAAEETPPPGLAPSEIVQWVLLSTRPVENLADALLLVRYYALRWRIERLHYTLKSGCTVEDLQHESAEDLQKTLALYYVVAWRLLWLTYTARAQPEAPAETVLDATELAVLRQAHRKPVTTAQQAVRAIARLAGWQGYRSAPDPGVKMLWLGLRRLTDMVLGWKLGRDPSPDPIQA